MEKTLYISDLDGTLLDSGAKLSAFAVEELNRMIGRGLPFTVATARTAISAKKVLQGLHLRLPAVLMNGVLIHDLATGENLHMETLSPKSVRLIQSTLRQLDVDAFQYEVDGDSLTMYHNQLRSPAMLDFRAQRLGTREFRAVAKLADVPPDRIIYFALLETRETLEPVWQALHSHPGIGHVFYKDVYSPEYWYLELFSSRASKRNAAQTVARLCGASSLVGFGDNLNDVPLFELCDRAYAVANAKEELKALASGVIGANTEDGVVRWLMENWRSADD